MTGFLPSTFHLFGLERRDAAFKESYEYNILGTACRVLFAFDEAQGHGLDTRQPAGDAAFDVFQSGEILPSTRRSGAAGLLGVEPVDGGRAGDPKRSYNVRR